MRAAAVCLLLIACGPTSRNGDDDGATVDANTSKTPDAAACHDVVDVVFVLDVSSSMSFVLDKLGTDMEKVVVGANGLASDAHFGLIAYVDNHVLDATGPLEAGKVHTTAATLKTAFAHYKATYTTPNREPGDGPSGRAPMNPICEENSLDALYAAAMEYPWRPNATRVVIVATDDTFLEAGDNYGDRDGDGQTTHTNDGGPFYEGNYPAIHSLTDTVAALRAQKIRVFSFTAGSTGGSCGRSNNSLIGWARYPASHIPHGWSEPYNGQPPIPTATDGKNFSLSDVQKGTRSLADTINEVVLDSYCNPIIL
jgi:hypothetical protein